jgi:xylulokinase
MELLSVNILGIDIGTTNTKVAAFNLQGRCVAGASRKTNTYHPVPEFSEHDPEEIWLNVTSCIREVLPKLSTGKVIGIGVTSFGEAGVPLGTDGKPLYNMIAWHDQRTRPQVEYLDEILGKEKIYNITGQFLSSKFGITKMLWIKENHPVLFEKCRKWLSMEDYIIYRLTGEFATDYSIAARTLIFDINRLDWSDEILNKIGISGELLPQVFSGATVVGQVTAEVGEATGLTKGIPVVTGGHDHSCAAIGVKVFEPGTILDSMGTAESTVNAVAQPLLTRKSFRKRISIYPHCGKPLYRGLTSIQSCGAAIEWYLSNFGKELGDCVRLGPEDRYELLMKTAQAAPPGAMGLHFIPHLRGMLGYSHVHGAFLGLSDVHGFGEFARAIIEGNCFDVRDRLESCESIFSYTYSTIRVVGGASKSEFWMQAKADILGRVVEIPDNQDAAGFGAALMTAVGIGVYQNEREAAENMYRTKKYYYPRADMKKIVDHKYQQFVQIDKLLKRLSEKLNL